MIALSLAVLGVASLAGAWMIYSSPTVDTVTEQRNQQSFSAEVDTSAVVTGENTSIYDPGERLENMPVYLFTATPNVTLHVRTSVPEERSVRVTQALSIVFQATRDGEPFYTEERDLVNQSARVRNGTTTAAARVNMSALRQETAAIRAEIGPVGAFQVRLSLQVSYRSEAYQGELQGVSPIQITEGAYWFTGNLADSTSHSQTVTRRVRRAPNPLAYGGLAILGVVFLVGSAVTAYYYRRIDVSTLESEFAHSQFDEWISNGEFPTGTEKKYISINSLEDLVDIAIDSNKRVVFDSSLDVYAVVDGDLVYYFSSDPFSVNAWLDT